MLAGVFASQIVNRETPVGPPRSTALGSLLHYITHADPKKFQPANITFDLLPPLDKKIRDRQQRHKIQCELALGQLEEWLRNAQVTTQNAEVGRAS
jgi:methylenetetrahydrofolate--tRNA-(uracil-5-)-methyltransferase